MIEKAINALVGWKGYAAVGAVCFIAGVLPTRWYYRADVADMRADQAESVADSQRVAREILARRVSEVSVINERNAKAEWAAYGGMRNAQIEDNGLRADVDAGRKRLRVSAICPASSGGMSERGTSASVGDGARPELDRDSRSDYFALRDGIRRVTAQLEVCQARFK